MCESERKGGSPNSNVDEPQKNERRKSIKKNFIIKKKGKSCEKERMRGERGRERENERERERGEREREREIE